MIDRPPRKAIPVRIKRAVCARQGGLCKCGCGQPVSEKPRTNTHFDHEPALILRDVNRSGTDYVPPQHSARHIDARCPLSHKVKTSGSGATTAGTDIGKRKKERKRRRCTPKKRIASVGFRSKFHGIKSRWPAGRKMQGRKMLTNRKGKR
jgi:hypothetical protein